MNKRGEESDKQIRPSIEVCLRVDFVYDQPVNLYRIRRKSRILEIQSEEVI